MSTIPQQPITAKRQRLELNGGPDSPVNCGCSCANDYRGRIDPSTSLATALRLRELRSRQLEIPFDVMVGLVGDKPKADATGVPGWLGHNATGFTVLMLCT